MLSRTLLILTLAGAGLLIAPACLRAQLDLRVSETAARRAAISKTEPVTPAIARQMKLAGRVEVEITIDAEGNVEQAHSVSGPTLLASAGLSAVRKWKFEPFKTEGKPVKAIARLTFDFK